MGGRVMRRNLAIGKWLLLSLFGLLFILKAAESIDDSTYTWLFAIGAVLLATLFGFGIWRGQ